MVFTSTRILFKYFRTWGLNFLKFGQFHDLKNKKTGSSKIEVNDNGYNSQNFFSVVTGNNTMSAGR